MKIGILQTGHAVPEMKETLGDYDTLFAQLLDGRGYDFDTWFVVDNEFPPDPGAADAWLITGSKHGAYEDHPWIPPLEGFIRAIGDEGRPLVGICFGHQIIAQAFGGQVEKFAGGWAVGRHLYEIEGETLALNAWHQDQVTVLPEAAQLVGRSAFCAHAALRYGPNIYSVQPHPEFTPEMIDLLIRHRGPGVVPEDRLRQAAGTLSDPVQNDAMAERMAAVLDRGRR